MFQMIHDLKACSGGDTEMPTSVSSSCLAPFFSSLLIVQATGAPGDGSGTGSLPPKWRIPIELLAPGFGQAQFWPW